MKVTDFGKGLRDVRQDLKDTLTYLQRTKNIGRALAAPQIGYRKKLCLCKRQHGQ